MNESTHSTASPILQTRQLTKAFGGLSAVQDVDFQIQRGQVVSVIGPNGAGKSTFFNLITGLYIPTRGQVLLEGHDLTGKSPDRVLRSGIARTFQNIRLFAEMTVVENVLVGYHSQLHSGLLGSIARLPGTRAEEKRARDRARELLSLFGPRIVRLGSELARNLSYADRRSVEIARALASNPKLLLLDEPTVGMNPAETLDAISHIGMIRQLGVTVVLIEHKLNVVMNLSDHVVVLDYGQKIAEGTPAEIQANEKVIEAYLGRRRVTAGLHEHPTEPAAPAEEG